MTNVLLSGLLAGTLSLGAPTGDGSAAPAGHPAPADSVAAETAAPAGVSVFATARPAPADPKAITQDTYAYGVPSELAPIKLWVSYAYGEADGTYDTRGEDAPLTVAGTEGDILVQRLVFGGQINAINFPVFKLGVGAQGVVAKNRFVPNDDPGVSAFTNPIGEIESDFEFQNVKVFGSARGRVVGVHGGYIFDLGSAREFGTEQATIDGAQIGLPAGTDVPVSIDRDGRVRPTALVGTSGSFQPLLYPTSLATSDNRDAIFFGADFDVPDDRFRVFGGIDYFMLQGADDEEGTPFNEEEFENDDYLNFLFGLGVKASVFEVGAALQIQTRLDNPTTADVGTVRGIGGHVRRLSPYLRISPPQIPASIFVKGAVLNEYSDSGIALGGANGIKSNIGFTAGLSVGFN